MGFGVVGNLVTHSRLQNESPSILELGVQFAFEAEQDVAFFAPVIGDITRRVFDHADADSTELAGAPVGAAAFARVLSPFDLRPISRCEWYLRHVHDRQLLANAYLPGLHKPEPTFRLFALEDAKCTLQQGKRAIDVLCAWTQHPDTLVP